MLFVFFSERDVSSIIHVEALLASIPALNPVVEIGRVAALISAFRGYLRLPISTQDLAPHRRNTRLTTNRMTFADHHVTWSTSFRDRPHVVHGMTNVPNHRCSPAAATIGCNTYSIIFELLPPR